MGGGDKETAYKVKSSSLKRFFVIIFGLGMVLLSGVLLYSTLYTKQRAMFLKTVVMGKKRSAVDKAKTIRLGQQLQAALNTADQAESRILNRVNQVVVNRFSDLLKKVNQGLDGSEVEAEILETRSVLVKYIKSEMDDLKQERMAEAKANNKQLEKIAKFQEQSIRDLLKNVAGTRIKALEDMVDDIFEAVDETPDTLRV